MPQKAGPTLAQAVVCRGPLKERAWSLEKVPLRNPGENELLVRVIATGICHTDVAFGSQKEGPGIVYPRILGHEGAGIVAGVGSKVNVAKPGDAVILASNSCGACLSCRKGHSYHCAHGVSLNLGAEAVSTPDIEPEIMGGFFGQSSFANFSIVKERTVVNVSSLVKEEDLRLFAPLGCGFMTGSGSVVNVGQATQDDMVVVMGLGGVGMGAIMAAKVQSCKNIVAISRVASKLTLAEKLGATHTINITELPGGLSDLTTAVRKIDADGLGPTIAIDTTGFMPMIQQALDSLRAGGRLLQVGLPSGDSDPRKTTLAIPVSKFVNTGISYIGVRTGSAVPREFLPKMINWWKDGKLPLEELVRFYEAQEFHKAIEDMHVGDTIKSVLVWK